MRHFERTLNSTKKFEGRIISVRLDEVELENGKTAFREVVDHSGGVCILALDKENMVTLVQQYRYPYGEEVLELPAGKRELGENPLECAKRELMEETGLAAQQYTSLGELYPSPGYVTEVIYMYLATGLVKNKPNPDEDEFLTVIKMSLAEAVDLVMEGRIKDSKTGLALLKADKLLNRK